jgi:hypothetical protein
MIRRIDRALCLVLCMAAFCGAVCAQAQKTITLRMLDSRTGKHIATTDFLVRINHEDTAHANWVTQSEDGTIKLTLPDNATVLSVRATYDSATSFYVNCDADTSHWLSNGGPAPDHWYKVADILALGVVAPAGCSGKKITDKLQVVAKPGEFIFYVRKQSALEQFNN